MAGPQGPSVFCASCPQFANFLSLPLVGVSYVMFSNLNGSIGLGMAAICLGPFHARWDFLFIGVVLLSLVYVVRHRKGWARMAAFGAVVLSFYVLREALPGIENLASLENAIDFTLQHAQNEEGLQALFLAALAVLSVANALVTFIWGQSRQTARSFEKLGL